MKGYRIAPLAIGALFALPRTVASQVIDLTVNNVGIAIGDKPSMTGLRLNFRDRNLREIKGVNVTIWSPYEPATGRVSGLGLGLPATGAKSITGAAVGVLGVGAEETIRGIGVGGIGLGAGGELRGLMVGGIGVGSGGGMTGIGIGGIGVGSGGPMVGLMVGGIGVGSGGSLRGISIGGIGVGSGGSLTGLSIGGIGVGGGGDIRGISIGGVGVGGGGDITGVSIGGVGVGGGGTVRGLAIGGIGVGAPRIEGVALAGFGVGGHDVRAIVLAPAYFRIEKDGSFEGGSLSLYNNVLGRQHGVTIGVFNYAKELAGVQIGLINVSDNGGARRVRPIVSVR